MKKLIGFLFAFMLILSAIQVADKAGHDQTVQNEIRQGTIDTHLNFNLVAIHADFELPLTSTVQLFAAPLPVYEYLANGTLERPPDNIHINSADYKVFNSNVHLLNGQAVKGRAKIPDFDFSYNKLI